MVELQRGGQREAGAVGAGGADPDRLQAGRTGMAADATAIVPLRWLPDESATLSPLTSSNL